MIEVIRSQERYHFENDWLSTYCTFPLTITTIPRTCRSGRCAFSMTTRCSPAAAFLRTPTGKWKSLRFHSRAVWSTATAKAIMAL